MKAFRIIAVLGAIGAFPACAKDGKDPAPVTVFSVTHYEYAIDLGTRRATAELAIEAGSDGDCFDLPFDLPSFEEVQLDGVAVDANIADGLLHACGKGWEAGEVAALRVTAVLPLETWGGSDVGFSRTADLEGNDFTYLLSWVGECDRHGACDSRPNVFATYHFTVDHPSNTRVLCPGTIVATSTQTTCDFTHPGGPTYSTFAVLASRSWTETTLGVWGAGVTAKLFDTPSTGTAVAFPTTEVRDMFEWMTSTFGPYPYGNELRFAIAPTYWAGFEHPGNISLSQTLANQIGSQYTDPLTHTTIHEVAHQWAGDQTTLADTYDFVWKEAMAEYLSFVHEESISPSMAADTAVAWKVFAEGSGHFLVPDERPSLLSYYGDVYGPGPMILFRQLEGMFGRPAIILALQDLLGEPRAIGMADVEAALEARTGADLGAYFDAWVYGSGDPAWPRATVTVVDQGAGNWQVGVTLATADGVPRGCKFSVRLNGGGGQTFDVPFDFGVTGSPIAPVVVTPGLAVTSTVVDPLAEALVWEAGAAALPPTAGPVEPWRIR